MVRRPSYAPALLMPAGHDVECATRMVFLPRVLDGCVGQPPIRRYRTYLCLFLCGQRKWVHMHQDDATFEHTNQRLVAKFTPRLAQESAQFSAMAVELSDSDTVGTALTLQMALGFTVTVVGIFTIPLVEVRGFVCTSMQIWFFVCASWGCFGLRAACNALGISSPGQAHFDSPMCLLFHFFFLSPPARMHTI